jgi:oligopeptide/dipeptide ABC transporter ATP-binding protein
MNANLLTVEDLTVAFEGQSRPVLSGVNLQIPAEGWMGLVGESGSGKSLTSLAIIGLLPAGARVLGGRVMMDGQDLLSLSPDRMRRVRGSRIGMIFQSPRSALNPLMTVGAQIARSISHQTGRSNAERGAVELLRKVQMPDPELRLHAYPHQLSGGMCQRVLIAMMLAARPRLLIADAPTTGLDVTVEAEILDLMHGLQEETGMAVLLITHDLGIVAEHCRQVAVMYGGRIVEEAPAELLFRDPGHPYTAQLMATLLRADHPIDFAEAVRSRQMDVPAGSGCCYAARCSHVEPACIAAPVELEMAGAGHLVACRRHHELAGLSIDEKAGTTRAVARS